MTLAFSSDEASPLVHALLDSSPFTSGVDLGIDARDEMLAFLVDTFERDRDRALFAYFRSGASIADSMLQVLRWRFGGDLGRMGNLLDFASGYGRVTRFLVREVPPEQVWVSDVYAGGVEFQSRRFGVHGIVSAVRPEDFECGERFGAILVTSLFTHLPEERFVDWLRVLCGLLAPGGVLVFSAHGPEVLPAGMAMPASGFLFQELSESGSLAKSDYGSTWVTEDFVRGALARAAGEGRASLHRLPRGLCNYQDLYVATLEPGVDFSGLGFRGEPELSLEHCSLGMDGVLNFKGWAAERTGVVREVRVLLDRALLITAPVKGPRDDVAARLGDRFRMSGWGCAAPLPAGASRSRSALVLSVVDDRGVASPLFASTIDAALLGFSRLEVGVLQGELERALEQFRGRLEEERAQAASEAAALQARIAAMEASRFWKARNAWFRFKRMAGLTEET